MRSIKVYAGYNIDKDTRMSSSSGGVFSLLAEYVLSERGVVYGVRMSDDCYSAKFTRVTDVEGLVRLRGSKYLQAKVGDTYKQIKEDLLSGKLVLFSGTGCQVNGLKKFLGNNYDNLICVDVICHGVSSPALWREYVKYQEQKNNGKLKIINFRCKDIRLIDFGMKEIVKEDAEKFVKELYIPKEKDSYMQMFLKDYCLRPSCYECVAKRVKLSDLTIADFWGIDNVAAEMNDGTGISLILIRTDKGQKALNRISAGMVLKEVSYESGVQENPAEYKSCVRPPQRDVFFDDMNIMSFEKLEKKYIVPVYSLKTKMKRKIKDLIKSILRTNFFERRQKVMKKMDYFLCFIFDCQEQSE